MMDLLATTELLLRLIFWDLNAVVRRFIDLKLLDKTFLDLKAFLFRFKDKVILLDFDFLLVNNNLKIIDYRLRVLRLFTRLSHTNMIILRRYDVCYVMFLNAEYKYVLPQ